MPNFPKNEHFLPLIRTRTYQGVTNVRFSENLACFVFLKHFCNRLEILLFALLPTNY